MQSATNKRGVSEQHVCHSLPRVHLIEQLFTVQVLLPEVISTPYWHCPTVPLDKWPLLTSHLKIAAKFTEPELA